ncbi:hypothetical protein LCGC14_1778740 [marine sediment metagenome]|uniref:Uncharacterized protein n=1 Tax=marine sediment metagenome TaxID=412755 RepID=A0A0F9HIM3_9ZZZZ
MKIKVFYDGPLNVKLDEAISVAVKPFGYIRWTSDYLLIDDERYLIFDTIDHSGD